MSFGQLGQTRTAAATATLIYSPAAGVQATDLQLTCLNTTATADLIRVYQDPAGATEDESTALIWDLSVPADSSIVISIGPMNTATIELQVESVTANAVTFTLHGQERLA